MLETAADASTTPDYAAVDMSRKRKKLRPDAKSNTAKATASETDYDYATQQQVAIPVTTTTTTTTTSSPDAADDAATNSRRPEVQENPEYFVSGNLQIANDLETNVVMTAIGDLDTEMTENELYERGDDVEQGGDDDGDDGDGGGDDGDGGDGGDGCDDDGGGGGDDDELYSLQQPVTGSLIVPSDADAADHSDDAADDTDDVQMQENEMYES